MEAPSARGHRGRVPWQGILLAALLFTFWTLPVTAEPTVEPESLNAKEGQDVLLRVRNVPENPGFYEWFRGEITDETYLIVSYKVELQTNATGKAHSGRETIYANGSLLIQNITQADTGNYTLQVTYKSFVKLRAVGQLRVYPVLPKPHITSNNSHPVEHKDPVVLTCEPETQDTTYLWSIKGQSPPDGASLQLSQDNRTLTLLRVTRTDTGPYVCETRNPLSAEWSDPLTLNVLYGPDVPTISPSHDYYSTGANLSLSCHAASHPPAQYSWLVNGRPQQASQELSIHSITESDSGTYTCLAHNNATGLNSTTVKNIMVSESVATPSIRASNTSATEDEGRVVLTCLTNETEISTQWLFNNQSLQPTDRKKLSNKNLTLTISPVRKDDAGEYQCEVSNLVSSSRSDPITLTVISAASSSGLSSGAIAGIVIGVLAGVALLGGLGYFLYHRKTGGTIDHRDLTENKLSASSHSQDRSDNLANKTDEVAYSSLNFNNMAPKKPASSFPNPTATDTVYSEVKK